MAKGLGIIGNFKGKVGNVVGYNLKDSNNKQTQGLRAYQPVVRNPKTSRQAEQRAKMAPINATYRALKGIIDRGQEGVAYGNKSRLRFLSEAMKQFDGPWFGKGEAVTLPIKTNITRGSLPTIAIRTFDETEVESGLVIDNKKSLSTIGDVSSNLLANNPILKEGDQLTFVEYSDKSVTVFSIVLDPTDTTATAKFTGTNLFLTWTPTSIFGDGKDAVAIVLSREGDNGQHLRSTTALTLSTAAAASDYYKEAAKDAAIESYMAANGNTDWPQESL